MHRVARALRREACAAPFPSEPPSRDGRQGRWFCRSFPYLHAATRLSDRLKMRETRSGYCSRSGKKPTGAHAYRGLSPLLPEMTFDCLRYRHLPQLKLVFLDDALIRFALALDAILERAIPFRKTRENLVETRGGITQGNDLADLNRIFRSQNDGSASFIFAGTRSCSNHSAISAEAGRAAGTVRTRDNRGRRRQPSHVISLCLDCDYACRWHR